MGRALIRLAEWKAPFRKAAARLLGPPQESDAWERTADGIVASVLPLTMVHPSGVRFAIEAALSAIRAELSGVIVECGVWKGGCSLAVLLAQRAAFGCVLRPLVLLDSFAGLPPVGERDGPLAAAWQEGAQPDKFLDNCAASEAELHAAFTGFGFGERDYRVVPGWFATTAPAVAQQVAESGIAMLRLDGDWYESTKVCLDALIPVTRDGATVIIDDYYAWDGCARAVHDYLSTHDLPYRLKSLYGNYGAYFVKQPYRASFDEF